MKVPSDTILQLSKANKIPRVTSSIGQNCAIIASNSMVPLYVLEDLLVHNRAVYWLPALSPMGHSTSPANCIFLFSFLASLYCNSSLASSVIHPPSLSFLTKPLYLEPLSDCRYIYFFQVLAFWNLGSIFWHFAFCAQAVALSDPMTAALCILPCAFYANPMPGVQPTNNSDMGWYYPVTLDIADKWSVAKFLLPKDLLKNKLIIHFIWNCREY